MRSSVAVRRSIAPALVVGVALIGAVARFAFDRTGAPYAAQAVVMLIAAGHAALAGGSAQSRTRWSLVGFAVVGAAAALVRLAADPGHPARQLLVMQVADVLAAVALLLAAYGIGALPRSERRWLPVLLPVGAVFALGLAPLIGEAGLLAAAMPAVLALVAAAALTAVALTRTAGRLLVAGAALTALPALGAVDSLVSAWHRANPPALPELDVHTVVAGAGSGPSPALLTFGLIIGTVVTAAPAALVASALTRARKP